MVAMIVVVVAVVMIAVVVMTTVMVVVLMIVRRLGHLGRSYVIDTSQILSCGAQSTAL